MHLETISRHFIKIRIERYTVIYYNNLLIDARTIYSRYYTAAYKTYLQHEY